MINEIKDLALTLEELREKKWIRVKPGQLHELEETHSPYEKHIETIAGYNQSTKNLALAVLINKIWKSSNQVVVMGMGPVSTLIIYWVSYPMRNPTHGKLSHSVYRNNIVIGDPQNTKKIRRARPLRLA